MKKSFKTSLTVPMISLALGLMAFATLVLFPFSPWDGQRNIKFISDSGVNTTGCGQLANENGRLVFWHNGPRIDKEYFVIENTDILSNSEGGRITDFFFERNDYAGAWQLVNFFINPVGIGQTYIRCGKTIYDVSVDENNITVKSSD